MFGMLEAIKKRTELWFGRYKGSRRISVGRGRSGETEGRDSTRHQKDEDEGS